RLPLAVGADDEVVEGQREFDDGIKPWEGTIARPHFLDEDSAVAGAEDVDHSPSEDRLCKPIRDLRDRWQLLLHRAAKPAALFQVVSSGCHARISTALSTRCNRDYFTNPCSTHFSSG